MKKCSKCKKFKSLDEFSVNVTNTDGFDYHCKICHNEYTRKHYLDNKAYYKDKARKRIKELLQWYKKYKSELKCEQCGEENPICLDFHHKDRKIKEFTIPKAVNRGWGIRKLIEEISKCSVLCCKCHRILHHEERMARECDG